jgi:hypothetical protein
MIPLVDDCNCGYITKLKRKGKKKKPSHLYMYNFIIYNQYNQLQKRKENKIYFGKINNMKKLVEKFGKSNQRIIRVTINMFYANN